MLGSVYLAPREWIESSAGQRLFLCGAEGRRMPSAWCYSSSIWSVCLQLGTRRARGIFGEGGLLLSLAQRDGPAPRVLEKQIPTLMRSGFWSGPSYTRLTNALENQNLLSLQETPVHTLFCPRPKKVVISNPPLGVESVTHGRDAPVASLHSMYIWRGLCLKAIDSLFNWKINESDLQILRLQKKAKTVGVRKATVPLNRLWVRNHTCLQVSVLAYATHLTTLLWASPLTQKHLMHFDTCFKLREELLNSG